MHDSDNSIEYKIEQKNKAYYDFMSKDNAGSRKNKNNDQTARRKKNKSRAFTKQEIHLSDLPLAPQGYESIFFGIYALVLPYVAGYLFLGTALAGSMFKNNVFAGADNFFIVWIVGYEVVSILAIIWITILFLKHDPHVV